RRGEDLQIPGAAARRQDQQGIPDDVARDRRLQGRAHNTRREDPGGDGGEREASGRGPLAGGTSRGAPSRDARGEERAQGGEPGSERAGGRHGGGAPRPGEGVFAAVPGAVPEGGASAQGPRPRGGSRGALRRLPRARHAEVDPAG